MKLFLVGLYITTLLAKKGEKSLQPNSHVKNPFIVKNILKHTPKPAVLLIFIVLFCFVFFFMFEVHQFILKAHTPGTLKPANLTGEKHVS